jgi:hypothetical protein
VKHIVRLSVIVFVAAAASASAQTKFTMSGKCDKPEQQVMPAPDAPGHMMSVSQGKCTPVKAAEIAGSQSKESTFTEHGEFTGTGGKVQGVYVDTLANGERVHYRYQSTDVMLNGALQSMKNTWQIVGGSAKLKGIKGQGTCTGKATPEGGLTYDCQGEYTLPPAKK